MRKLLLLILGLGMAFVFTGCANKAGYAVGDLDRRYISKQNQAIIGKDALITAYMSSRKGMRTLSREGMRKEAVASLFQNIAKDAIAIKRPYFYIFRPAKFAAFGINKMKDVDKLCINGSGGAMTTLFSVFDDTGINRGCQFTMGGNSYIGWAFAEVALYKKPPLNVPTFDANEVLAYMKKHGLYVKGVGQRYEWIKATTSALKAWEKITK